ncbi:MAG: CNNM domain-containing protein [Dehalococcoidia bacterium]|nr:CNNM domain-containing protein [Dehalococcoidia bacterium]
MSETWSIVLGLAALVLLIAFNALFVAAEFAFVGVRRTRVEQLAGAGRGERLHRCVAYRSIHRSYLRRRELL